jgi:hypothetical protein
MMDAHVASGLRWGWAVLWTVAVAFVITSSLPARAQSVASSTIRGTVSDETGSALPGVTATLASPALLVGQVTSISGADGSYRFGDLPDGAYQLKFELPGFKILVHDELRIPIGFVAIVNATMVVGGIEESVTVSGQSPVVDMASTATSVNLTQATLESVPVSRGMHQLFAMTPGVTNSGAPDVGDSNMNNRQPVANYGGASPIMESVEGINIVTGNGSSSGVYFTTFSVEEVQIKTSGNDAEVSPPGVSMVVVLKSGSNQFHGSYGASGQRPELQSANLDARLQAQGVKNTESLKYYFDVAGDLGGRIIKDKLWFYGALNRQKRASTLLGFASGPGPDGKYLTGDEPLATYENVLSTGTIKVSYQLSSNNKLISAWQPSTKYQPQRDAGRFVPLEATRDYKNPTKMYKGELQSTLTPRIVANVVAGYGGLFADYSALRTQYAKAGHAIKGNPSKLDKETGLRTGPAYDQEQTFTDRWEVDGSVSFYPESFLGGRHELKAGTSLYWEGMGRGCLAAPWGQYFLVYEKIGGVSGTPTEIDINNCPTKPNNRANVYAGFLKDTWRLSNRVTVNWGVRWEQQHAFIPEQSKVASWNFPDVFPALTFPATDVQTWRRTVPRLGLAWNLDSKTVVKTTYGLYGTVIGEDYALPYNPNSTVTEAFRWSDPSKAGDYVPGDVNFAPSEVLNISGGSNQLLNPGMKQPLTTEVTGSYERELKPNLGIRLLYVFKSDALQYANTNILRPYSAYNIPITRRDPGPDGLLNTADDGKSVTIYDFDAAFRGAAFVGNQRQASPRTSTYHSAEFTVTKRSSGRWSVMASGWVTKNHRWLTLIQDNPNNDPFPLDETWSWAGNLTGSYRLPGDVQFGAYLQSKQGVLGQRTNVFQAGDPDGGKALVQQLSVTLRMEPYGSQHLAALNVLNLRTSKRISLGGGRRVEFDFDVFNLLNSNAPTGAGFASGRTFGFVTAVLPPRVARFGFNFSF